MKDQEDNSVKETQRKEKLKAEEAEQVAKDQARKKAYLAREQEIEKGQKSRETRQAEKRASEDIQDSAREKARKETYLAQEKKIAEGQEARKLKDKQQSPD
jgi:hypothetical protein